MENIINTIIGYVTEYGLRVVIAIVIFLVGRFIAKKVTNVLRKLMEKANWDPTLVKFLGNMIYILLLFVVLIITLQTLGIDTTSFIAILGAATLAIGFALKDNLSNFAAGVMLLIFRPFEVGHFIEAGGTSGVVEEIGVFNTKLRTGDNKLIYVPNSSIVGGNIVNYSAKDTRRIDLTIGVSYEDDLKKVKEELWKILNEDERILKDPAPTVAVAELADSSVNLVVRPWVKSSDYWPVYFDLLETIKTRFDEVGISIPYPQLDVHLKKEN
ncbi:MAG: mechanosensitive ion channel [Aquificae bacterium]|nr:mechanosensitive ion channel [Aquificota bacterium]